MIELVSSFILHSLLIIVSQAFDWEVYVNVPQTVSRLCFCVYVGLMLGDLALPKLCRIVILSHIRHNQTNVTFYVESIF